uniref:HAUS augmin-like complex subunit 3 N-terminal domain-containing protein n=1 Tax=Aquila chrysaetos chrysaetos TaxID=223781 RepID=A0A663EVV8_AQUCH
MQCTRAEFVATLRLVYPHADTLCEKDFEWLFDCPQTKQFLEWFCSTVGEENVLSPAEVEAYDALLAAGKPILEGDALEQVLQMCHQVPQLPSTIPDDEGLPLEALQQELQELKDYRDRQLWRHSKLQVWTANLQRELRCLEEEEKVVKQDLRKAQMDLEVEAFQTRAVLSQISKAAKQLAEWHGDVGKGRLPALLCEMDLGPYMELEQQATNMFESFIQQVLPGSVQAPDAQGKSAQGKSSLKERLEAATQMDSDWKILEGRRGSQAALVVHPDTSLSCLPPAQHVVEAELRSQAAALQKQLHALRCDIAQILTHRLPPLLKAEACFSRLPILQRQLSLEAAHLQYVARRQEEAAAWLASQHSRLDLLELQLKWERKELDQKASELREMKTAMREAQTRLQEQQDYFKDASSSQKCCPRIWIDPKDLSAVRQVGSCFWWAELFHSWQKEGDFLHVHMYLGSAPQEITDLMQQLITMQDNLYQKLADLLSDLKVKRRSLESPILQTERNLYVYFYCNEDWLREVVEELEKQVWASSKGPVMELPYAKE